MIFTTKRLTLAPFVDDDYTVLVKVLGDPTVMKYVGHGEPWPPSQVQKYLDSCMGGQDFFTMYSIRNQLGEFVGEIGFQNAEILDLKFIEFGYTIAPSHQNQGFASEAATVLLDQAKSFHNDIFSLIHEGNHASQRLATKLGMVVDRKVFAYGSLHRLYRVP